MAPLHTVKVLWDARVYDTMFPITEAAYHARRQDPDLPGRGAVSGAGRSMCASGWTPGELTFTARRTSFNDCRREIKQQSAHGIR
jgi:hypothetical protein